MKGWRCPGCNKINESEDKIIMKICYSCQKAMKEFPYVFKRRMEVEE